MSPQTSEQLEISDFQQLIAPVVKSIATIQYNLALGDDCFDLGRLKRL